jgi:hypothetical protein
MHKSGMVAKRVRRVEEKQDRTVSALLYFRDWNAGWILGFGEIE